jgi:hypothetical protein
MGIDVIIVYSYCNGNNCRVEKARNDKFAFSSAVILSMTFLPFGCLGAVNVKLHAKFGENRINGSEIIRVYVKFNMAAGGHLGL